MRGEWLFLAAISAAAVVGTALLIIHETHPHWDTVCLEHHDTIEMRLTTFDGKNWMMMPFNTTVCDVSERRWIVPK